jgi:hypothetical protein
MNFRQMDELFLPSMKSLSAYIFFILYLFSTTEAYQVLKFPVILEHFHEHQKENKSITFLEFLDIHYMHGSPMDDDYERDMQLPFKRMNHHVTMTQAHVKDLTSPEISVTPPIEETDFIIVDDHTIHSRYLSSIFQPPRA